MVRCDLVLHPARERESVAGRTRARAAFAAAGALVLHGPRPSVSEIVSSRSGATFRCPGVRVDVEEERMNLSGKRRKRVRKTTDGETNFEIQRR